MQIECGYMKVKDRHDLPNIFLQSNARNSKWIVDLPIIIERICSTTGFNICAVEDKSRFGLVLYGKYRNNDAVLKILPKDAKSYNEMKFLTLSKCPYINKPIISDIDCGYYISPKGNSNCDINDDAVWELFQKIYACADVRCEEIWVYCDKIEEQLRSVKAQNIDTLREMLLFSKQLYSEYFCHDSMYMLHGDLRLDNLIHIDEEIRIIDPLGINAPLEFSFLRYIEDKIFKLNRDEFERVLKKQLANACLIGMDERKVSIALLIDSTVRTVSSALRKEADSIIFRGIDNYIWIKEILKDKMNA